MSNTKRKIRRRRQHLDQLWDLIATKARLLGDNKVAAFLAHIPIVTDSGRGLEPADSWMLKQMNITPSSKARMRFRAALLRTRQ